MQGKSSFPGLPVIVGAACAKPSLDAFATFRSLSLTSVAKTMGRKGQVGYRHLHRHIASDNPRIFSPHLLFSLPCHPSWGFRLRLSLVDCDCEIRCVYVCMCTQITTVWSWHTRASPGPIRIVKSRSWLHIQARAPRWGWNCTRSRSVS